INKVGFIYLETDNPNIQYGAARYRQTKRPLDRIYAIMQIYGLRVGEAANPNPWKRPPQLNELEDEFAAAICKKCPVMGQLFLHLKRPRKGDSWRITQYSRVPEDLAHFPKTVPKCTI